MTFDEIVASFREQRQRMDALEPGMTMCLFVGDGVARMLIASLPLLSTEQIEWRERGYPLAFYLDGVRVYTANGQCGDDEFVLAAVRDKKNP